MARKKYKATGCARFLLVLLILIPAAYFGAKAIRGGEGIPAVEKFIDSILNKDEGETKAVDDLVPSREIEQLRKENDRLKQRIKELEKRLDESNQ